MYLRKDDTTLYCELTLNDLNSEEKYAKVMHAESISHTL